ncbi:MAG: tRNA (N6-isopentenyl adenosine(37)-C2)-methylthiotransferase MiaB [Acidobacteria bacterium]|nr:tRNA (N6-isopentenyl adenosine(37)-C2)-methylthiotransferase MiaB [Acidobacteriota bacterium]
MNELDSEKAAGLLHARGLCKVASPAEADLVLINTCSVREKAESKVYTRLGELKRLKKERGLLVGVLGCVAQQMGEEMLERSSVADLVVGTHRLHQLPDLVQQVEEEGGRLAQTFFDDAPAPMEIEHVLRESRVRAYVTIMEGCDKSCTFCIVPFTRGRERNRPSDRILDEVHRLADEGYCEILLLGQNVNSYADPSPCGWKFPRLLQAVAQVPGIRRVRFTSPHPIDLSFELIDVINDTPTVCDQVHLPVQSGSDRVLRRMKRLYNRQFYLERVRALKRSPRNIALSTDIIVGFPGETRQDFRDTLSLMDELGYDFVFSFKYSARPRTPALKLKDGVPEEEKAARLLELQEKQKQIQLLLNQRYLGQTVEVLVEGEAKTRWRWSGRTSKNKIVNFDGPGGLMGRFAWVRIEGFGPNSLHGMGVSEPIEIKELVTTERSAPRSDWLQIRR